MQTTMKAPSENAQVLILGDKKIPSRITTGRLRRVAEMTGIDLTQPNDKLVQDFTYSPITVCTVCYWLYKDHLDEHGITEEEFEEMCGTEEIAAMRAEVDQQMRSFSPYWRTVSTLVEEVLSGSGEEIIAKAQKMQVNVPEASGPSS